MSRSPSALAFVLAALAATGCDAPPVDGTVVQRIELADALGLSANVVGVTIDPNDGATYVLDAASGIHRIVDGAPQLVLGLESFPEADVWVRSGWLDFAAMGDGRFALVAQGDGFLLDIEANTLSQWFCYEPGWMEEEFEQESHNLAYDPINDQILSAPLTIDMMSGEVARADVAIFDGAGAGDLSWYPVESGGISFGGMARSADGSVLLGAGAELYGYDLGDTTVRGLGSLAEHGITDITGMMIDPATGHLLVLDGSDNEVVVLDL